jgi:hypothetical protein
MDITALDEAYRDLLAAADAVATADNDVTPPPGEWNADQILAHAVLVNAATIAATSTLASGVVATYDNRLALDTWTIDRVIAITGDTQQPRKPDQAPGSGLERHRRGPQQDRAGHRRAGTSVVEWHAALGCPGADARPDRRTRHHRASRARHTAARPRIGLTVRVSTTWGGQGCAGPRS